MSSDSFVTESIEACDSFSWNGNEYTTSGVYDYTSLNAAGCDSLSFLDLTLGYSQEINQTVTSCDFYTVTYPLVDGQLIEFNVTESTLISYTILNSQMCDSTINLEVIISDSVFQSVTQIDQQCGSYEWNNNLYTESGTYYFDTSTANGCDSIAVLELAIIANNNTEDVQTHCQSYTWINNVSYTESTNSPFLTYEASTGCDSIVTLNLTILEPSSSNVDIEVCDSYTWNGNTYSNSGQYSFETSGSQGCDSIAFLNLSVSQLSDLIINGSSQTEVGSTSNYSVSNSSGSSYQWQLNSLGSISSGQGSNSISILWDQDGAASVCVVETDQNGCEGQQFCFDVTIFESVNIDERHDFLNVEVYPNPFKNELYIDFSTQANRNISLIDLQGRVVYSSQTSSEKVVIKREMLKSGSYVLKIICEKGSVNKSVILN